ncbi:hypothetical protein GCM10009304_08430 [Pseudomonas matsuisoli]|uniref:Uncharacterized protein n=1 Tax=Pseudomonas matsuisoli TaxID=1515666 RepID=A0A917PME0_9PSED|nr:hypothetical protein GCM10009304_08430 [Pseudomonas matsuisoli]
MAEVETLDLGAYCGLEYLDVEFGSVYLFGQHGDILLFEEKAVVLHAVKRSATSFVRRRPVRRL